MPKEKDSKFKLQITFFSILFTMSTVAEVYATINYPDSFIVIAIFAVLIILFLFLDMQAIFAIRQLEKERHEEQYESIFKSEKASYLMLKKYFEEITDKIDILMTTSKVPTEEIVNAQKGVAKVIINRSRENAEAMMNSNDLVLEKLDEFENAINGNNDKIVEGSKTVVNDSINQIIIKQQEIVTEMKDMEIRINQQLMQVQTAINNKQVNLTTKVEIPPMASGVMPTAVPDIAVAPTTPTETTPVMEELPIEETPIEETPTEDVTAEIPVEEPVLEEAVEVEEPVLEEAAAEEPVVEEVPEEEEPEVEEAPAEEAPAEEPIVEETPAEEPEVAEEPAIEETAVAEEPAAEEKPPMPDLSDPNAKMSADDIAALFANMAPAEEAPAEEPVAEEEPAAEEKPPMPDLSDPNAKMSADDIAALFANMAPAEEPVEEEAPAEEPIEEEAPVEEAPEEPAEAVAAPAPDMGDPNKKMDPDEIAALIASMDSGDSEPVEEASVDEPVIEEAPIEEKPPMPDMSDPNKKMSPEEIAALIANM